MAHELTRSSVGGLSDICQRAVNWFLGLVTVLPEQHEADLLLQIRRNETISYLPIHDVIWSQSSHNCYIFFSRFSIIFTFKKLISANFDFS